MARTLAALLQFEELRVCDFSSKLNKTMQELAGINHNFRLIKNNVDEYQKESGTVFEAGSFWVIKWSEANIKLPVFWDDVSDFHINGEECKYASLFVDVGGARNCLGYLLASVIIVVLAREARKLIEDTSLFWVDKETLDVEKFVDKLKISRKNANSDIYEVASSFCEKMNSGP